MNRPYRGSRNPSQSRGPAGRGRKAEDPILLGEPSPALTKIAKMNTAKLREHVATMKQEFDRMEKKIANLKAMPEPNEERIEKLNVHRLRLAALMKAASERLIGKLERSKGYANNRTGR